MVRSRNPFTGVVDGTVEIDVKSDRIIAEAEGCAPVRPADLVPTPEWNLSACTGFADIPLDQKIAGCTAVIGSASKAMDAWQAYNNRGAAYFKSGEFDRAMHDFSEAIRLKPNSAEAYANRGNIYFHQGQYDRAAADYDQAIRFDPKLAAAYANRGSAHFHKREFNRAIEDYEAALRLDPGQRKRAREPRRCDKGPG
ncbi:MAG: tetratricopeptide repeat protein [Caulobacteraceae bacterium]